jgi:phosphate/sulfate permease
MAMMKRPRRSMRLKSFGRPRHRRRSRAARDSEPGLCSHLAKERPSVRNNVYQLISQLRHADEAPGISADDKEKAKNLASELGQTVAYAPWWVRVMSALCLGIGTMIGYQRIVETLGGTARECTPDPGARRFGRVGLRRADRIFRLQRASG